MTDSVIPLWINGKEEVSISTFDVVSPHNNEVCWRSANAVREDALKAVEAAKAAFPSWSQTKPAFKQKILFKAADLLEERIPEYGSFMRTEMGADIGTSDYFVLPLAVSMMRDVAGRISTIVGSVNTTQDEGTSAMVWKEPYGVTLGIAPWNAPYVFGVRSIANAIATGNTTIIKGSELTPRCYWAVGKALHDAGLPPGVVNVISCAPSDAPALVKVLVENPAIKHINFTGSAATGRKIAELCGRNLKPCLMELGGKNSAIVLEDADLQKAAMSVAAGAFLNSGQICMSTDRILIHEGIAEKFLAVFKNTIAEMAASSPSPPLVVSAASQNRLQSLISDAISRGAHVLTPSLPSPGSGAIFTPTVIGEINPGMIFSQDEAFGPLVGYIIVRDEEEAIELANATEYGLAASVFTQDLRRAFKVAKRLESGAVHINSMTVRDDPGLPFGGVKNSGWGRFNTEYGFNEFLVTKSVTWDD
ncbi:aldehyde dehydrogenase domain-containing protein [Bisporella sp. PMI_857]|nr:aldehyde dehydrogenase domain-containing protein [Bisporella sp. PMI_857]